ncbi:hypothetical protein CLV30_106100 [Haloactinopolyspora alba]|uniref:Uncharacterized protein n=1 Tax=Haloactinopolyspora alba TaxID=648780 RepID=A0A2P8E3V2_9ACTN|nr:hypothetical protein CLV30_106100 [Haloactinopolyspora alba]
MSRRVESTWCHEAGKRSFATERDAEKALGRSQTSRRRKADAHGTRRGLYVENRYYECGACEGWHLTSQSRHAHNDMNAIGVH